MVHTTYANLSGVVGTARCETHTVAGPRLSKGQSRCLSALHAEYAGALESALGSLLNGATVSLISLDETTHEPAHDARSTTNWDVAFNAIMPHAGILRCSAAWVSLMLDHLLGETGERALDVEPLSDIEKQLLLGAVEPLLAAYADVWARHSAFIPFIEKTDARYDPGEPLYLATYEARTSRGAGTLCLVMRLGAWQQALNTLGASEREEAPQPAMNMNLLGAIGDCQVTVRALLGSTHITVSDLLSLRDGDVICLDRQLDAPLEIRVGNHPKLRGHAHLQGDHFVVKVDELITGGDV